jgi:hypothetical protein
MKSAYVISTALAAVVAATSLASAQGFRDDPPGWAYQRQSIIEDNGYNSLYRPWRPRRTYDDAYRAYGYAGPNRSNTPNNRVIRNPN